MEQNPSVFQDFFKGLRRRRAFKAIWAIGRRLVLFAVLLLFALYFLLQVKAVQNFIVQKATTHLSDRLHTTVSIQDVEFEFFDNLLLKDIFIADLEGDTLLFAEKLRTSMSANLLALINNRIDLDDVTLSNAKICLGTKPHQQFSNLQKLLNPNRSTRQDSIPVTNTKSKKKPIDLDIQHLVLDNVHFKNINQTRGFHQYFDIESGHITFEKVDLISHNIEISSIEINNPDVMLQLWHGQDSLGYLAEEVVKEIDSSYVPTIFSVDQFYLNNGAFKFNNYRKAPEKITADTIIDYRYLRFNQIDIDIQDFTFDGTTYLSKLNSIAFNESSGFVLNKMSSKEVRITDRASKFNGLSIKTPYSELGDTLIFKYRKYEDIDWFVDRVLMEGRIKNSKIALRDIMSFAPALKNNAFFKKNRNEQLGISGKVSGRVKNLRGKNLNISLADGTKIVGNFSSRNLTIRNQEVLNLQLEKLETEITTLRLLIPNFNPPSNFDKLGRINFNGRFDGFFADFVAFGALQSDLGRAELDMRMDLTSGREQAKYSGELSLGDFDLGAWSGNSDLGIVNFNSTVEEGFGLTLEKVNTALSANIQDFTFRGYNYKNIDLKGKLTKHLFDGNVEIKDDNIDLGFKGAIQFGDSIPEFDFAAEVNHLNLNALNLSKRNFVFSGDLDLNMVDIDIAKLEGKGSGRKLLLIENGVDSFALDSLMLKTTLTDKGFRILTLNSDILTAEIDGVYVLNEIPEAFLQYFESNFPEFAAKGNIKSKQKSISPSVFNYSLSVPDSKNFLSLINPELGNLSKFSFDGKFDALKNTVVSNLEFESVGIKNMLFKDVIASIDGNNEGTDLYLEVNESKINNIVLEPITIQGNIFQDTLGFQLNALSWTSILDNLQLKGTFNVTPDYFNLSILPADLAILQDSWRINENNYIRFDKDYLEVKGFELTDDAGRSISINSIKEKGLQAFFNNFSFSIIDQYWDYEKLDFDGNFFVNAKVDNVFDMRGFGLNIHGDTLIVNGEDWGSFNLDGQSESMDDVADVYFNITREEGQLVGEGKIIPPAQLPVEKQKAGIPYLDFSLGINQYPLHIAEYWLSNGISNTTGQFDSKLVLKGPLNYLDVSGDIRIYDGAVTIDFLNTRYFIEDEMAKVNNYLFDVSGAVITDSLGNIANLSGGITHDHLRNLGLNCTLRAEEFAALNTTKAQSDVFYGKALAKGFVTFTGSFKQPNIFIDASPLRGTNIIIPMAESQNAGQVDFINFIDKSDTISTVGQVDELHGVSMDMRLSMNENALMQLVFDEKTGDIIQGSGDGDISINLDRNGDFEMFGNYTIRKGEYLFIAYDVFNKPFTVEEGGTIRWSGNPYEAIINLNAEYNGLQASMLNFISEYPISEELQALARKSTRVDLTMNLAGELSQPDIKFDLSFPELPAEIRSYVESKLLSIKQDQNELNRQVFGLMMLGTFFPSGSQDIGSTALAVAFNTLSEFVTSQLSLFLTDLIAGNLQDGGALSGIELDVGFQREVSLLERDNNVVGLNPKLLFFDDRLTVNLGGDYNFSGSYLDGQIVIEWAISKNRRLKVQGFARRDQSFQGVRNNQGVGISYSRQGNTFKELFQSKKKKAELEGKEKGNSNKSTDANPSKPVGTLPEEN